MTDAWKQWEGQVVDGKFHLRQYLGGCENSAVFLTELGGREPQKAAIKLIPAPPEKADLQLSLWELAAKLSHPHLIRLFQMGRCQLGNMGLLYVVMEYAEENLSQVLPHRPLTPAEAREMLEPILDALAYVHGQGFVHGHMKPENVMHVEDQLKISSDGLCRIDESRGCAGKAGAYNAPEIAGGEISPAADVWSLGITLVEALTQRLPVWEVSEQPEPALPETLPSPFLELARHCLQDDPQRRWTVAEILAHMSQTASVPKVQKTASPQAAAKRYLVPAAALVLVLAAVVAAPRLFNRHPEVARTSSAQVEQLPVQQEPARKPVTPEAGRSMRSTSGRQQREVVEKILPEVPQKARDTIRGKVRVGVRVLVDPSGSVVNAKLDSAGPSKYFAELALQAARRWKFGPTKVDERNDSSEGIILRFEFMNVGTKVVVRAAP
jgi:TonB family protein